MQSPYELNTTSIASSLRNTNGDSGDIENFGFDNFAFFVNISATAGGGTATLTIEAKDPLSGSYFPVLVSAALAATGQTLLQVGNDIIAAANLAANAMLPQFYRVSWVIGGGGSVTFSVGILSK